MAAAASASGHPAAAGYLLALLSLASAAGGLVCLLMLLATGTAAAGFATSLPALAVALALTGLFVAPAYVVAYILADQLVDAHVRTETSTWFATASNLGGAAGAVTAGLLIEHASARAAFLLGELALLALTPILAAQRHHKPVDSPSSRPPAAVWKAGAPLARSAGPATRGAGPAPPPVVGVRRRRNAASSPVPGEPRQSLAQSLGQPSTQPRQSLAQSLGRRPRTPAAGSLEPHRPSSVLTASPAVLVPAVQGADRPGCPPGRDGSRLGTRSGPFASRPARADLAAAGPARSERGVPQGAGR